MKRILALVAAASLLALVVGTGTALAVHKDGHQRPPACDVSQGAAPQKNKHCYPVAAGLADAPGSGPSTEASQPQAPGQEESGLSVGMVAIGAAGLLGAALLARHQLARSRRRPPAGAGNVDPSASA